MQAKRTFTKRVSASKSRRLAQPVLTGDSPGLIYFIQAEHGGPVKIGWALDPWKRLTELQCGNPYRLRVVAVKHGTKAREHNLHKTFEDARLRGEWFEPTPRLLALMATCPAPNTDEVLA